MSVEEKDLAQVVTTMRSVLVFGIREKYGKPHIVVKECYQDHMDGQIKPYGREISFLAASIDDVCKKLGEVAEMLREGQG